MEPYDPACDPGRVRRPRCPASVLIHSLEALWQSRTCPLVVELAEKLGIWKQTIYVNCGTEAAREDPGGDKSSDACGWVAWGSGVGGVAIGTASGGARGSFSVSRGRHLAWPI